MVERRRLPLIPAAKIKRGTYSVLQMADEMEGPAFRGESSTPIEWTCGARDKVLTEGLIPGQVQNVVIRCTCGAYNDTSI